MGWKRLLLLGTVVALVSIGAAGYRIVSAEVEVAPREQPVAARTQPGLSLPEAAPFASNLGSERVDEDPFEPVAAYGVNAGHPAAVEAGMAILERGGNAVDAAIATAFAVGVAEPFGSGIGGGGAALILAPGAEPIAYDYRDVVNASGAIPASEIGIPGFVAGMEALHASYGTIDLAELIEAAVVVADEGVEVYAMLADQLRIAAGRLPVEAIPHFYPGGQPLQLGDRLVQPELADTLRILAAEGTRAFYEGAITDRLVTVEGIDAPSLAAYEVRHRTPVSGSFGGYEVLSAPPPLAGATLIQMLQIAEAMGVGDHEPGSADYYHALAMGWRAANHYRTWQLADPDFVAVPTDGLTDAARNAALAATIPSNGILDLPTDGPLEVADGETTHLTVVDADGMMVSMTNTLTNIWGSGRYELGFFLNDSLGIFPGQHANQPPEPGKRAVSSTVPTILVDDQGRAVLGLGSPGGSRIPAAVANVVTLWALHGQTLADAVEAPRFHLDGSTLRLEEPNGTAANALRGYGYGEVTGPAWSYYFGSVQALEIDHEGREVRGAADPRRAGGWRVEATP